MSIVDAIERFPSWIESHPVLFSVVIAPALLGIVNAIWAPRTAEQYAAMPPRLAAFFKVLTAVFPNPAKAIEGMAQIKSGTVVPAAVVREAQRAAHADELAGIVAASPLGVTVVTVPGGVPEPPDAPITPIPSTRPEKP